MKHDNSCLPLGGGRVGEAGRAREEIACFIPPPPPPTGTSERAGGEGGEIQSRDIRDGNLALGGIGGIRPELCEIFNEMESIFPAHGGWGEAGGRWRVWGRG